MSLLRRCRTLRPVARVVAAAALSCVAVASSSSTAYDQPYKAIPGGAFSVDSGPVPYEIDPIGSEDIADDSESQAIRDAFRAWQCVPGTKLRFEEQDEAGPHELSLDDDKNTLFWDEDGSLCRMGPGTLGITVGDVGGAVRHAADICFNGKDHEWSTDGSATDVGSIAAHEIGHFLGLDHPCDGDAPNEQNCNGDDRTVMTPVWNNAVFRTPMPDDEEGVRALYPAAADDPSTCDGPFRAGERCACDGECVEGLLCIDDGTGVARCGSSCAADNADCGGGAFCVLSAPEEGDSAKGVCLKGEADKPAGAICANGPECASGTCAAVIALGRSVCQQPCSDDSECKGTCFEGFCVGGFSGTVCPAQGGCACDDVPDVGSGATRRTSWTGVVVVVLAGGMLVRMRRGRNA